MRTLIVRGVALVAGSILAATAIAASVAAPAEANYRGRDGQIAFTNSSGIFLINADGSGRHRIFSTPSVVGGVLIKLAVHASWSPTGKWIAFDDAQGASSLIYEIKRDGSVVKPVVHGFDPSFGVNGALAFVQTVSAEHHVFVKKPGRQPMDLGVGEDPEWSPSGARIAYRCGDDICTVDPDGSANFCVTCASGQFGGFPSWAPAGGRLAFQYDDDLFVIGTNGAGLRRLTNIPSGSGVAIEPAWSPSARWIAYAATDALGRASITKIRVKDGVKSVVANGTAVFPSWQATH